MINDKMIEVQNLVIVFYLNDDSGKNFFLVYPVTTTLISVVYFFARIQQ